MRANSRYGRGGRTGRGPLHGALRLPGIGHNSGGGVRNVADWSFQDASLDLLFTNQIAAMNGLIVPFSPLLTMVRSSLADYADTSAGLWLSFAANTPRLTDKGLLVEESRINLALWCRDLTNAAWVKTTMSAAKTAVGIDGAANSATTITASGALSTILQTVVQASTADTVSFFVKRRTGTGTVEVTADDVAWTDITAALATAGANWYRATISATLVNPVIGVRITTDTDAVDVDFAQLEAGTFATSPILTTTVAATRAADVVTVTTPPSFGGVATLFASAVPAQAAAQSGTVLSWNDGTNNNRLALFRQSDHQPVAQVVRAGVAEANFGFGANWNDLARRKMAIAVAENDVAACVNGGSVVTDVNVTPPSISTLAVGSSAGGSFFNGRIERVAIFNGARLSGGRLQSITG